MSTSKVNDDETINFIYNSSYIEEHAKPNNTMNFSEGIMTKNRHPLIKYIKKEYLTPMEFSILKKILKMTDVYQTPNAFVCKNGFPRVLIHIHDPKLLETTKKNNYQHYLNIVNLPPPIQQYAHTLNNTKVQEINDKRPHKIAAKKIVGLMPDKEKPIVFGNNKETLFAATKRAIKTAPTPSPEVVQDFIQHSIRIIEKELGPYLNNFSYSYSQWYNHLSAKKQKLIEPIYLYYNKPDIFYTKYTEEEQKRILTEAYEAICKSELQEKDGKPRMVCSIPQKYKYAMGPITWRLEELCCKYLQGYCGNKNLSEMEDMINNYHQQGYTKVVEGDGSAFDNTQDISLKEIDRYLYRRILKSVYHIPQQEFLQISQAYYKKMQVKYRDVSKKMHTFITYYVLGTVFSGDCDTTLCNTIRMALYNRYVNDKAGLKYGQDYVVFSKGDDFSILYKPYIKDKQIQQLYYKYFLTNDKTLLCDNRIYGLGQICKFLDIGALNSFKFCSLRSWYKNMHGDIVLTRDPAKLFFLSKYSIKYKTYNLKQQLQYHLDMMVSYIINYPGINVFYAMAAAHAKQFLKIYKSLKEKISFKRKSPKINLFIDNYNTINPDIKNNIQQNKSLFEKYVEFYDCQENEHFYKIQDSYWETMKRLTMTHNKSFTLTQHELDYINEQINNEFDYQYILKDNDITNIIEASKLIKEVLTLKNF